jgi:membrane associated rhomboid family serine protease
MSSGADLFVVCKQCGSEVSPYVTECPYCGHRLRRRAPKLPRVHAPSHPPRGRARLGSLFSGSKRPTPARRARPTRVARGAGRWASERPYATIALVAASCVVWVVCHAKEDLYFNMAVIGPLGGDWWKLFTNEFAYLDGVYAFVALLAIAIFGWLLERRHGPVAVLVLFFAAGATGALVASAIYPVAVVSGANAAALALLSAWAVPDLGAARAGSEYDGDLLGVTAMAALLLAIPFARPEVSWVAGLVGAALGLLLGFGMHRLAPAEA